MKTKTYKIEVVRTCTVKVIIPESMNEDEFIKDWESGLWKLENREDDIAEYAAHMAVEFPTSDHDGIGRLITSSWDQPDYSKDKYLVKAVVTDDETETEILSKEDWKEPQASPALP